MNLRILLARNIRCACRCAVLPDSVGIALIDAGHTASQCTYRCVVLPDWRFVSGTTVSSALGLNAPTGAWCSLTRECYSDRCRPGGSQCTYRCAVLPDCFLFTYHHLLVASQCTYRCAVLPDDREYKHPYAMMACLNAPTGARCSLTPALESGGMTPLRGPGAPPAPGALLRTGQHRTQSST